MQSSPASTWQPGDPIRFAVPDVAATGAQAGGSSGGAGDEMASESQTARRGGGDREWQTGDPIRFAFGQAKAARDEASRPRPREVGVSPVKKQARTAR